ncbi:hypothetical protein [Chitinophaga parva]|nr:hypothetical protein [Chitinophaga parva]
MEQLGTILQQQGIRVLLRQNVEGQIYGTTFIDNATRCVFNGGDLGKPFATKAFMERLGRAGISHEVLLHSSKLPVKDTGEDAANKKEPKPRYPASDQQVFIVLQDGPRRDNLEGTGLGQYTKKRKKLGIE